MKLAESEVYPLTHGTCTVNTGVGSFVFIFANRSQTYRIRWAWLFSLPAPAFDSVALSRILDFTKEMRRK